MVRKYLLAGGVAAMAMALAAAPASAGRVAMSSAALTYFAATGETNDVTITRTSSGFTVTDTGAAPTADPTSLSTCASTSATTVTCVVAPGANPKASAYLADGDDRATFVGNAVFNAQGGPGADTLIGGSGVSTLHGDGGDDTLTGGPAADHLEPGDGNDVVNAGGGDDLVVLETGASVVGGGDGSDTVWFLNWGQPVTASLDGLANDGAAGEDHLLGDIENLRGEDGDDTLIGNDGPNRLEGYFGDDTLIGGGGDDEILGDVGTDRIAAGAGADDIHGDVGDDHIAAGDGDDSIHGGDGVDRIEAGDGDDVIDAGEGADTIEAGPGDDELESFPLTGASDILDPGTGNDFGRYTPPLLVTYASRSTGITGTVQGQYSSAQVTSGDERDVFWFVASITGGAGNDVLTSSAPIRFDGGAGDDRLTGSTGADTLIGGLGRDVFDAGAGADRVEAAGDRARDTGTCGDGADVFIADQQDALAGCETAG